MLRSAFRQRSAQVFVCLALVCSASSCERLMEPEASGQLLTHVVTPSHVQLTNRTSKPVFFALMEEGFAARANVAACVDMARCPSLAAGASKRVEFERIAGYSAESERAVLYWWHADGAQDGIQHPERIRTTSVRLR